MARPDLKSCRPWLIFSCTIVLTNPGIRVPWIVSPGSHMFNESNFAQCMFLPIKFSVCKRNFQYSFLICVYFSLLPHPSPQPTHIPFPLPLLRRHHRLRTAALLSVLSGKPPSETPVCCHHRLRAVVFLIPFAYMGPVKHPLSSISPPLTPKHRRLSLSTYRRDLEEVDVAADSQLTAALASSA